MNKNIHLKMEDVKTKEPSAPLYPSLSYEMDIAKHKDRVRYMKDKEAQLLLKLEHYNKLRKRWTIAKNVTQGVGACLTISLGALTIVISSGVLTIPVVATALTGTGVFTTSLATVIDKSVMSKKRKSLSKKHAHVKEVYDKLHYYFQRVCDDNVITLDEIEKFDQIAREATKIPVKPQDKVNNEAFLEEIRTLLKTLEQSSIEQK